MSETIGFSKLTIFASTEDASIVISSNGKISGAVVSITETNCVRLEKLFDESMVVHVTTVSPIGKIQVHRL